MTDAARFLKEIREERKQKLGSRNYSMRAVSKCLYKQKIASKDKLDDLVRRMDNDKTKEKA